MYPSSSFEPSYYEASVSRPSILPPAQGVLHADVCVIGAGFSGLSCALTLAEKGYRVIVLEAQAVGWGSSGRNGGQVIVGYANDAIFEQQIDLATARQAWNISYEAAQLIRQRIETYQMACEYQAGFMSLAVNARKADRLFAWADTIAEKFDYHYQCISPLERSQYIRSPRFHSGIFDEHSGHFHPLKYALGLAQIAQTQGVQLYEQSPVIDLTQQGDKVHISTANAMVQADFAVCAGGVYLNRYAKNIAPAISRRIMPVGTYMIATEPLSAEVVHELMPSRAAVCDTNFILDYFRFTTDRRLLYGGGVSYTAKTPSNTTQYIRQRMLKVFPQLTNAAVAHTWGGCIDVTYNRGVDFGRISPQIYYMQGFSGQGVALSNMAGKLVAQAIAGQAEQFDIFTQLRHRPFPRVSAVRQALLILGALYYRLKDAALGS